MNEMNERQFIYVLCCEGNGILMKHIDFVDDKGKSGRKLFYNTFLPEDTLSIFIQILKE